MFTQPSAARDSVNLDRVLVAGSTLPERFWLRRERLRLSSSATGCGDLLERLAVQLAERHRFHKALF